MNEDEITNNPLHTEPDMDTGVTPVFGSEPDIDLESGVDGLLYTPGSVSGNTQVNNGTTHEPSSIQTTPEKSGMTIMTKSERKALNRKKYRQRKKGRQNTPKLPDNSETDQTDQTDPPIPDLIMTEPQPQSQSKPMASYLTHWNQMYNIVEQFKEQYNRLPTIRGTHKMEATVGRWIYTQQLYMKKNILPADLVEKLRSLGI